jgi:hypothetical protein
MLVQVDRRRHYLLLALVLALLWLGLDLPSAFQLLTQPPVVPTPVLLLLVVTNALRMLMS